MYLLVFVSLSLFVLVFNQTAKNNFGPYDVIWKRVGTCKGPKPGNCGEFKLENTQNMSDVIYNFNIEKDCPLTKGRITIGNIQDDNSVKKMFSYGIEDPCTHFMTGPVIVHLFNASSSCKINKGRVILVRLDAESKFRLLVGKKFFYGLYHFKIFIHNKNNNFMCAEADVQIDKMKN